MQEMVLKLMPTNSLTTRKLTRTKESIPNLKHAFKRYIFKESCILEKSLKGTISANLYQEYQYYLYSKEAHDLQLI